MCTHLLAVIDADKVIEFIDRQVSLELVYSLSRQNLGTLLNNICLMVTRPWSMVRRSQNWEHVFTEGNKSEAYNPF